VIAVGGTTLNLNNGSFQSETYWYTDKDDGGSAGDSAYEPRPVYQNPNSSIVGTFRGTNDCAAVADPNTGCAVYDSTPLPSDKGASGWLVFGGTSLACPICAAILSDRGYSQPSSYQQLSQLYGLAGTSFFRDITSGSNGTQKAAKGYDFVTGLGSLVGVFVNHPFTMSSASLVTGTALVGQPGNMILKDNHFYTVRSVQSGSSQIAEVAATFKGSVTANTLIGGTVIVTGTCGASTTALYALNLTTGLYDQIGTVPLGQTSTTQTISNEALGSYVNSSGTIQLRVAGGSAGTTPFRLSIDQITFTAGSLK
jgi:subtilase family serine protease